MSAQTYITRTRLRWHNGRRRVSGNAAKAVHMPDIFISHSTWLLNPTWGSSLPGFPVAHHFLSHFGKAQTCLCKLRRLARAASSRRLHQVSRNLVLVIASAHFRSL